MTDSVLDRANDIMEEAVEKAGELLHSKPHIAEVILKQLLRCDPEHLSGLQLLGLCKHRMGENAEAVEIIQTALDLDPDNADNWNNIGIAYGGLCNPERAIQCIKKAIELKPDHFLFKNNLALRYRDIGDYDRALNLMKEALAIEEKPQLWLNLGGLYGELRDIDKAEDCFARAAKMEPNYAAAYVDLAFAYHLKGDWKKGFAAYEWRFNYYPQMKFYLDAYDMSKIWDGDGDVQGKRFLIYSEQGLGDCIQFVRYAKDLKALGAHVTIHCPDNLETLVRRVEGVDATSTRDIVNNKGPEFPEYDYQFSMMSFPYLLKSDKIDGTPYIKPATESFREYVQKEYGSTFNIGIVWAGSPAHPHDQKRSIPLKHFEKIADVPGVRLFSLQMDLRPRQYGVTYRSVTDGNPEAKDHMVDKFQKEKGVVDYCEGCENLKLVDLTKMVQNFDDTATVIAGLDMVICCDTAVAHLAGAMGVPVWVLVAYNPDWRWTLNGEMTPWYDSMRLFRQTERDNWSEVFERVQKELHAFVLSHKRQELR
jgi:tetratricopeptide (TPR) repeat protein